jgi:hypothetical protein
MEQRDNKQYSQWQPALATLLNPERRTSASTTVTTEANFIPHK